MDHNEVVREQMTERYLLKELDPQQREEFEEHFFDCQECALDVRAATAFVEQSKVALAEDNHPDPAPVPARVPAGWPAWLRPAFAVPVFALLLVVIGYQNFVTYPRMEQALNRPQLLPWTSINVRTRGAGAATVTVPPRGSFLLFVNIPPDSGYLSYIADLYNPAGKLEWSISIPASSVQDQWPVQVPGTNRQAGTYTFALRGVTAAGISNAISRAPFELQIQK
jgi:anti-sigma factor RsiW